jgi:3-oxoacyl-[acyl-carrier protein] reductase
VSSTVLISGGSRGLGLAIVTAFLESTDWQVATFSRKESPALTALQADYPARLLVDQADLTDPASLNAFVKQVRATFGGVDALVNNAGVALDDVAALETDADLDNMIDINLKGTFRLTRAVVRQMLTQQVGRIVNVTSIVGHTGYRGLTVYSMTKAGLDGFTRSLARELGGRGITVNSVAPGFLETEMTHGLTDTQRDQIRRRTPLNRLGTPADVVPLIVFLCSPAAGFITGQTIIIDGGLTA